MTIFMFANNVDTTLVGPISLTSTSLTLTSAEHLPSSIPAGQVLVITLNDVATRQNFEVIYATSVSGATLSGLMRAQEGTSALPWSTGDFAYSAPTSGQQSNFGQLPADNSWSGSNSFSQPILAANGQISGVVGSVRNAKMSIPASSAVGSWSADEVVLESALGGLRYCVSSALASVNLGSIGAGGMDIGSSPASGYVAIYGIYNPTAEMFSLLATNASTSVAPSIYSNGHMPSGYTASALISVWPTIGNGQFAAGFQYDRDIYIQPSTVLSTSTQQASFTPLSISGAVPPNAKKASGYMIVSSTLTGNNLGQIASTSSAFGSTEISGAGTLTSGQFATPLSTPQLLYYTATVSSGAMSASIAISTYSF
jgi:hypothetical protein